MKNVFISLFVAFNFFVLNGQEVSFGEVHKINRSMINSLPTIKKIDEGYLFFNFGRKKIYLDKFDNNFTELSKEEVELPEEIQKSDFHFSTGDTVMILKITKDLQMLSYRFNINSRKFEKVAEIDLGTPEETGMGELRKWSLSYSDKGLLLTCSSGADMGGGYCYWYISVFSISSDLTQLNWKSGISEPKFSRKGERASFTSSSLLKEDEVIVTYVGGTLGRPLGVSNYTRLYKFNGSELENVWEYKESAVNRESEVIEGACYPFLSKSGEFRYFVPVFKSADSEFISIEERDVNGEVVESYVTDFKMPQLTAKYYVDLTMDVFESESDDSKRILLMIEDGRKMKGKHPKYLVNLKLENGELIENYFIDGENIPLLRMFSMEVSNDRIIFGNALLSIEEDKVSFTPVNEVFKRVSSSGRTFNWILDDEVISIHSEYTAFNISTQVVRWKF